MARKIDTKVARKLKKGVRTLRRENFTPENVLFDKQMEVFYTTSRYNAVTCSRRAGKSFFVAFMLLYVTLHNDDSSALYIASTKKNAVNIIWKTLKNMIRDYNLPFKMNNQTKEVLCETTDSRIIIGGCKDESEIDDLRGCTPSPRYIAIDEAGHFKPYLTKLIQETLRPMLRDYMGRIDMIGTPNPTCTGAFYTAYTGGIGYKDFKSHYWSFFDNPRIPSILAKKQTHESIMNEEITATGRTRDDPDVLREFFGKWVKDLQSLLFKYDETKNAVDTIPVDIPGWRFMLGVDTGYIDNCAYTVMAYHENFAECYMIQSYKKDFKTVTDIIKEVNDLNELYGFYKIVFDPAAGGKNIMAELYLRYKLIAESAKKVDKIEFLALMNTDLLTGKLKVVESGCDDILHEWRNLVWEFSPASGTKVPSTMIGNIKDDHCSDSALYVWRECYHYRSKKKEEKPLVGSREYYKQEVDNHIKKLQEERKAEIARENRALLGRYGSKRSRSSRRKRY